MRVPCTVSSASTKTATETSDQSLPGKHFQAFAQDLLASKRGMAVTLVRSDGTILTRWPQVANQPVLLQ
jgi:hypothetical protein